MSIHSTLRFCRTPLIAALGLFAGSLLPAHAQRDMDKCPNVTISGNPTAYVVMPMGQVYYITATNTAQLPYYANSLVLEGCGGTVSMPAGGTGWVYKGSVVAGSSPSVTPTLTNTWTVANYVTGNYWWRAEGDDTYPTPIYFVSNPAYIGSYTTLPANDGGDPFGDPGGS